MKGTHAPKGISWTEGLASSEYSIALLIIRATKLADVALCHARQYKNRMYAFRDSMTDATILVCLSGPSTVLVVSGLLF